jgi:hypothetical protein
LLAGRCNSLLEPRHQQIEAIRVLFATDMLRDSHPRLQQVLHERLLRRRLLLLFFAPRTQGGPALRNGFYGALSTPFFRGVLEWMVKDAADLKIGTATFSLTEEAPAWNSNAPP